MSQGLEDGRDSAQCGSYHTCSVSPVDKWRSGRWHVLLLPAVLSLQMGAVAKDVAKPLFGSVDLLLAGPGR